jgi:O-methyltransferase
MSTRRLAFRAAHAAWRGARLNVAVDTVARRLPRPAADWIDDRRTALRVAGDQTLVPAERLERTYRDALALLSRRVGTDELGDYLEFGVFVGTSMLAMQRASAESGHDAMRLVGFDSFAGLPAGAQEESGGLWSPGQFKSSLEATRRHMDARGADWRRVTLVPGWYEDTLVPETSTRLRLQKASVIMVDCDLYSSARACLAFSAPLIRDEAVILFDDWGWEGLTGQNDGERRAFEELLAATPELAAEQLEPYSDASAVFHVIRRAKAR